MQSGGSPNPNDPPRTENNVYKLICRAHATGTFLTNCRNRLNFDKPIRRRETVNHHEGACGEVSELAEQAISNFDNYLPMLQSGRIDGYLSDQVETRPSRFEDSVQVRENLL